MHVYHISCTTVAEDRFLILSVRRQPTITVPELVTELQRMHNLIINRATVINRLHEANTHSRLLSCIYLIVEAIEE